MIITAEPPRALTVQQELALMAAAHARSPSMASARQLATLYLLDDRFDDVIAVLSAVAGRDYVCEILLANAHISLETSADDAAAGAAAERALALAATDQERAAALALRGKSETRRGDAARARATLNAALALDPHNKDACKRIAALDLAEGRIAPLHAALDDLQAQGAAHARLFGARVLAHARSGDMAAARATEGFASLHHQDRLTPPPGWEDIDAFNAALAAELLAHPGMRYERYGSASAATWRIENPARADTPLYNALIGQIIAALSDRVAALVASDHLWATTRPGEAMLRNWCVITESDGFEGWHVHQFGWLSGVYYVQIPDSIAHGTDLGGCLGFGLPDDLAGEEASAAFGETLVRPQPGMLLTFPSHVYHRTWPHGGKEKRICVAFDVRPV